jgi:hypothetical protein
MPEGLENLPTVLASALGLIDLILGSIALYWLWISYPQQLPEKFPTTRIQLVDVVLLACTAAATGKIISLLANECAGIALSFRSDKYFAPLRTELRHRDIDVEAGRNRRGTTIMHAKQAVAIKHPKHSEEIQRIEDTARLCYGLAIISVLYTSHFGRSLPGILAWLPVTVPAFLILAILRQTVLLRSLAQHLEHTRKKEQ